MHHDIEFLQHFSLRPCRLKIGFRRAGKYNGEYAREYRTALNELNIGAVIVKGQKTDGHLVEYVGPGRVQRLGVQFALWDFYVLFSKKLMSLIAFKRLVKFAPLGRAATTTFLAGTTALPLRFSSNTS